MRENKFTQEKLESRLSELIDHEDSDPDLACRGANYILLLVKEGTVPYPFLYQNEDGGIDAEWTLGDWDVTLDLEKDAIYGDATYLRNPSDSFDFEFSWDCVFDELTQKVTEMFEYIKKETGKR